MKIEKRPLALRSLIEFISLAYIFLFMYASVTKLIDYQKFSVQLGQSPMLTRWSGTIAWLVPFVEIIIAGLLVFKTTQRAGLFAALNLMTMFTAYIVVILNFSPQIPCSCGGVLERMGWTDHLVFNTILIIAAIIAIILVDLLKRRDSPISQTNVAP